MDALKSKRSQLRRLFSRSLNDFEKSEDLSIDAMISKLRLVEDKAKSMLEIEQSYREELLKIESDETVLSNEFDESEFYIDKWRIAKSKLDSLLAEKENISILNESVAQNAILRYPKLELPTFNGDIKNWLGFWGQFKKIDTDPNLDDHDKFAYLLQSMEKGSSAEELVKSFPPGGNSYSKALQQLKSRFGKEDLLIEVYVRDLLALVLLKNSQQKFSLRRLYDNLESKLRALEVLGVARDKYAAMLYPLVESSLPDDTLRAWQRFRAMNRGHKETESGGQNEKKESTHRMDLDGLLSFLLDEIEGEERVSIANKSFHENQSPKTCSAKHVGFKHRGANSQIPSASTLIAASEKNLNGCIFCAGNHDSGECYKARKMSFEERQKAVQNSRSCFLCLDRKHFITKCQKRTSCVVCGRKHHILLCKNIQVESKSTVNVDYEKDESELTEPQRDETLANLARTPNVLLPTLMVTLRGRGKKRQARAIIDSASQRSYILKSTADEMQFESACKEKLSHSLFGGTCTNIINHDVFTVFLSKPDGSYHCNFKALGQDVICNSIPPIGKGQCLKELRENNISFSDKDGPIEILIGTDIAGKLMTGGFKLLAAGPAAIETKLGWTVFGKTGTRKISDNSALLVTSMLSSEALTSDLWSLDSLGILEPSEEKNKLEQKALMKKATDKRLAEALEDVNEEQQIANQWKLKAQKCGAELQDLRLMLEEQIARNEELEKKQRRFDAELSAVQEEIKKEKALREKLQREKDQIMHEKYSLEQDLQSSKLDADMLHEKITQLTRELGELTQRSKGEEEVTQSKRAKQGLEGKSRDQEELEELAAQVQMLEQAKPRLEMPLEKFRQEHRRETSERENYSSLQQKEADGYKKQHELEMALENIETDFQITKNDLRLACQRIQDLQNALEDDLDSGTDVPDDSGPDNDSSFKLTVLRNQSKTPVQRCESIAYNLSYDTEGCHQSRTSSFTQELSAFSRRNEQSFWYREGRNGITVDLFPP